MLTRAGVDQGLIQRVVAASQQADPQLSQQGPGVAQVDQAMNGNGVPA
jgi:hypothetical protein